MLPRYAPGRGDVIWIDWSSQAGHEQAARRHAFVLSPASYNRKTGLALLCPITSQVKGYPFEVKLPAGFSVEGVILSDQVKSLDWKARKADFLCKVPPIVLHEVLEKTLTLLADE